MPGWANSDRRHRLPPDWGKRRKRVLKRDRYKCQARNSYGAMCGDLATDVDHIVPNDDHDDENLRSLCEWHHRRKSSSEGAAASHESRAAIKQKFRRTETHPGLL